MSGYSHYRYANTINEVDIKYSSADNLGPAEFNENILTAQDEVSKTYSLPKSFVSYRKPRAISTEQRERARQMMIANNRTKGDEAKLNGIMYAFVVR